MPRNFDFYRLEDRTLLSGEGLEAADGNSGAEAPSVDALLFDALDADGQATDSTEAPSTQSAEQENPSPFGNGVLDAQTLDPTRPIEVVFIDAGVDDADLLINDLISGDNDSQSDTQWMVIEIASNRDGVTQITEALNQLSSVDAIHLVSHGDGSGIQLGNAELNLSSVDGRAGEIASWADSMDADADLLIYGCDLASTD
ncbi:MAG: DUF4347 domain-containing protein, partial [Rubripirellula sp.]